MLKKIMLILTTILGCSIVAQAQDNYDGPVKKELAQKEKAEIRKQKMAIVDSIRFNNVVDAVSEGYFVILVDRVTVNFSGYMENSLDNQRNFILVQGKNGVVQTSSSWGYPGFNNMGGITLSGKLQNMRTKIDKKGNISIGYALIGHNVNAEIYISLPKGSQYATAQVTPIMGRGAFTMYGRIAPYRNPNLNIEH